MNNDIFKATMRTNMWRGIAYCAGCAAIGYAIKVTKSATPLWALLLLAAPSAYTFRQRTDNNVSEEENNNESES